MPIRLIGLALVCTALTTLTASAQQYPREGGYPPPNGNMQPAGPDQPVQPQNPTLERRDVPPGTQQPGGPQQGMQPQRPPRAPFDLTPEQEAQVDQALMAWQNRNTRVKSFDARFKRWTYDSVFGQPGVARFVELGVLRYAAPDRGIFLVDTEENKEGQSGPIAPGRAEHWVCDGKSITEFSHAKKQVIVHKLPPESQGKAITDGPLPFLFCSDAKKLKQRYWIRLVEPPPGAPAQAYCLEAYPRFQGDAANFHHAHFIITSQKMEPWALNLIQPNGKDRIVYEFFAVVVNDPFKIFQGNPFNPPTPPGWQKTIEEAGGAQAQRVPSDGRR
jgi:TIGR03009 family protein